MVVLIVDDDRLVRFTIKSMLRDFLNDSTDIFLEATNGKEMVHICKDKKPDIVFADISMPYMNGLDAIAECKKKSPATQYVIVSGYSDFEYAQKGIRLGVSDYLLKPVDNERLRQVIEQIKKRLEEKKQEFNSRFQLQIMEAFNYFAALGAEDDSEFVDQGCNYIAFFLYVKEGECVKKQSLDFQKEIVKKMKILGEEVVSRKGHYAITNTAEGAICVIFNAPEHVQDYILSYMKKICMTINSKFYSEQTKNKEYFYYFRWIKREKMQEVYKETEKMDSQMYLFLDRHPGVIYEEDNLERGDYEKEFLFQIEKLLEAWKRADGIACKEIINKIWRKYREKNPEVDLKCLSEYCSVVCGCPISGQSCKLFFQSFVENSEQMYCGLGTEESDMIEQVKMYIQKNYMYDVSISQIAERFGLTANYLSTIFRRKTGEKFIDYLTRIRLEAAKKILVKNTSASVQDIALMVGYNSSRHFSALFQKQTGETPSVYRKSRL